MTPATEALIKEVLEASEKATRGPWERGGTGTLIWDVDGKPRATAKDDDACESIPIWDAVKLAKMLNVFLKLKTENCSLCEEVAMRMVFSASGPRKCFFCRAIEEVEAIAKGAEKT